jgi:phosphoesterase RecJ-like protein
MSKDVKDKTPLAEISKVLSLADSILIFPHIQIDGDALGSAVALCVTLLNQGKKADIVIEDKIPENLKFLDDGLCTYDSEIQSPDVCVAVDCSDISRIGKRQNIFKEGKKTILIDHHRTSIAFADLNFVDESSSSTGEIVYELLKQMKWNIDARIAEAIYTAILTDTGRFMYSNTTGNTHAITSELFDIGIDHNKVGVEIYQKKRLEKIRLMNAIMESLEMIYEGKACIAVMTEQMLIDTGALREETEGVVEELRSIDGVEIAAFIKEEKDGIKVTMRSKTEADVSKIATKFGGGGHKKAAGCTMHGTIEEVKSLITQAVKLELNEFNN